MLGGCGCSNTKEEEEDDDEMTRQVHSRRNQELKTIGS